MIVIKKRVSLEFLGDEYKEAYLVFKSIPAMDFDELMTKINGVQENEKGAIKIILDILKEYFISGQFPGDTELEEVKKEDLDGLDPQSVIECFKIFTGQELDPKVEMPLTNSSPTVETPQENI